ncbi:putative nucleotidyltransferase, ribonuclease H [Tanacetum coccineum]
MEDDFKPIIQPKRRLNPKVQDVVKNEIVKLLDSRLIYPISDSSWVSPIYVVPKKGGMTMVLNDNNELIPSHTMLERLSRNEYYYFLDGFLGFFQIPIALEDQEKMTFTCPYGTFAYRRMPFVFMDDLSVFGNSFNSCPTNLDKMLARCEETNLVLNWEKFLFMEKEGIVLGHKISSSGIEVDKAKIAVIAKLPYPTNVKGVRSFLGHASFYHRAFNILREKLTIAPIIISPYWNMPFELMSDASDFAVGVILGQRIDGKFKPIYHASKTLDNALEHYTTTEKELPVVVFAFDKFHPYLILSKTVVYTDHSALKYLFNKQDDKPKLIRWVLLLQGFNIKFKDKKGATNLAAYHLSRLENPHIEMLIDREIVDEFPDEHLMMLKTKFNDDESWYADFVNYIVGKVVPPKWTSERRKRFYSQIKSYVWDEPCAFKLCSDNIMRRCVAGSEIF